MHMVPQALLGVTPEHQTSNNLWLLSLGVVKMHKKNIALYITISSTDQYCLVLHVFWIVNYTWSCSPSQLPKTAVGENISLGDFNI